MSRKIIFLDIESRPQEDLIEIYKEKEIEKINKQLEADLEKAKTYKKEETIESHTKASKEKHTKALENIDYWKEMAVDPDYCEIKMIAIKELDQEPQILSLEEFSEYIKTLDYATFITYNGKNFDFRAIIKQGIKQDIDLPYEDIKKLTDRYPKFTGFSHIDLQEELGAFGKYKSLDKMLQIYLGISKKPIDFQTCTREELADHAIEDVVNEEKLFKKFRRLLTI